MTAQPLRHAEAHDIHRNGGAAVVESLAANGVDTIFGIPGTHNLELYRHLPAAGITAVTTRHEQGAGYAADGYHQVSGRPGVVITTSGPAVFNVAAAAGTAYAESRPLLIISPGLPRGTLGGDAGQLHETKDASGCDGPDRRLEPPGGLTGGGRGGGHRGVRLLRRRPAPAGAHRGAAGRAGAAVGRHARWPPPSRRPAVPAAAADRSAAAALAGASRAGDHRRRWRPAVPPPRSARLAERLGAPVITTCNGKGVLPEDHPLSVGTVDPAAGGAEVHRRRRRHAGRRQRTR